MVVVTFTWRHDGCQVLLCGSFDGWSEQILVNLVEGSAVVFQRIVDVPPGYHDYKFLVDGIWQVDQDQICVQDEYGAINNLVIVKESVSMPSVLLREDDQLKLVSGFASNMHLEASSSSGLQLKPVMQLLKNEMDISRHRLFMFLSSSQVFALDTEVAVQQAFHIMYEQRLAVMPLWDERSAMISGMLTASDFILILLKLQESHPMLTNNELEMHTVSAWKYGKLQLHAEVSGAMVPPNRRLLQAGPDESLKDVALALLQNKISAVPVLDSPEDGSSSQLLHDACLAGILNLYLPIVQQQVGNLPFGTWTREVSGRESSRVLLTLHSKDLLSSALKLLMEALVNCVHFKDINGLLTYKFSERISGSRNPVITCFPVLQVLDEASRDRCRTCTRFDSLYRIMELLSDPTVRRVVVIDPNSQHLEGIITLTDVFNLLLG
ncbi:unnamed protein product [Withania somnifera]